MTVLRTNIGDERQESEHPVQDGAGKKCWDWVWQSGGGFRDGTEQRDPGAEAPHLFLSESKRGLKAAQGCDS